MALGFEVASKREGLYIGKYLLRQRLLGASHRRRRL